jgi:hypothetical protein
MTTRRPLGLVSLDPAPEHNMRKPTFFDFRACIDQLAEAVRSATRLPSAAFSAHDQRNYELEHSDPPAIQLTNERKKLGHHSYLPRLLGVFGSAVLAAGACAPLIHIPIVGTISYLRHPSYFTSCNVGELVILAAAGLSIAFALLKRLKPLWLTGTVALAQLIATLATFQHDAAAVVAKADRPDLVDPMLMWAGAALEHARFQWGIGVVGCGAVMLLAAVAWEVRAGRLRQ